MRRQWLDSDVQALATMKESCLTENCNTNVLAILDTHDNACDHDASNEYTAPEQEWNPFLRWYRIYDLFYIVLFVGISIETFRECTYRNARGRIDGLPVACNFGETRTKQHECTGPDLHKMIAMDLHFLEDSLLPASIVATVD